MNNIRGNETVLVYDMCECMYRLVAPGAQET